MWLECLFLYVCSLFLKLSLYLKLPKHSLSYKNTFPISNCQVFSYFYDWSKQSPRHNLLLKKLRPTIGWWMDGGVYSFVCEAQDVFLTKQSFFDIKENMKHHNRKVMIPQKFHHSLQPLKVVNAWLKWIKNNAQIFRLYNQTPTKRPLTKNKKPKQHQNKSHIYDHGLWDSHKICGIRQQILDYEEQSYKDVHNKRSSFEHVQQSTQNIS